MTISNTLTATGGNFDIIRKRLITQSKALETILTDLNLRRKDTFGTIENKILSSDRVNTPIPCVARDMVAQGDTLLMAFEVHFGLKSSVNVSDIFRTYQYIDDRFQEVEATLIDDEQFYRDLSDLTKFYKDCRFARFLKKKTFLYMIFHVGRGRDKKVFKWAINPDDKLTYVDNRSDFEVADPPQYSFDWERITRDDHVYIGEPHINVSDRLFVDCLGGSLTIRIEDNTEIGHTILQESVDETDQTLDDAVIEYAVLDHIIILKILPYREQDARYFIYNDKNETIKKVEDLKNCGIALPENDGLMFPNGYYLRNGTFRSFSLERSDMKFQQCLESLNGEDLLYAFHDHEMGEYILIQYNRIEKTVGQPITCHGYAIFGNGKMVVFGASQEPMKSHSIQTWSTSFIEDASVFEASDESSMARIGNKTLVDGFSDLWEITNLAKKEENTLAEYNELLRFIRESQDRHYWFSEEEFSQIKQKLADLLSTATSAVDEFEKVISAKKKSHKDFQEAEINVQNLIDAIKIEGFETIDPFIEKITDLRLQLGEVLSLAENQFANAEGLEVLEGRLKAELDQLTSSCSRFLMSQKAVQPFHDRLEQILLSMESVERSKDLENVDAEIAKYTLHLNTLTDLINDLATSDPKDSVQIIEQLSQLIAGSNQVKAKFKSIRTNLLHEELGTEYQAQMTLLSQSVSSYLEQVESLEDCDNFLDRVLGNLESLEVKFSEFPDYLNDLAEKRDEYFSVFQSKRVQIQEASNKKIMAMMDSGARLLKSIKKRSIHLETCQQISTFFVTDSMVTRLQTVADEMAKLGETVKAEDLRGQLKKIRQDALRQLKDKQDLFQLGENIITLGQHSFQVSDLSVDLSIIERSDGPNIHISSTDFFQAIPEGSLNSSKTLSQQTVVSETKKVYRSVYLAYYYVQSLYAGERPLNLSQLLSNSSSLDGVEDEALEKDILSFMQSRLDEGYEKGVHDRDGYRIIGRILPILAHDPVQRFHPVTRALGFLFSKYEENDSLSVILKKIQSWSKIQKQNLARNPKNDYIEELRCEIKNFLSASNLDDYVGYDHKVAHYLAHQFLLQEDHRDHYFAKESYELYNEFTEWIKQGDLKDKILSLVDGVDHLGDKIAILFDWLQQFQKTFNSGKDDFVLESVIIALELQFTAADNQNFQMKRLVNSSIFSVDGLIGTHENLDQGKLNTYVFELFSQVETYLEDGRDAFLNFQIEKQNLIKQYRQSFKLDQLQPKILGSFVRNQLIQESYLPKIGENFAKQIGSYGNDKRVDLMGLLLLISPPGYGKTTLMEYVAQRLGLIFLKINGPAIGHSVTSLDPQEAPNATARLEIERLNFGFELGNNVMIYIDDIQHCHSEFLQKFISLCDGQRKLEGVWQGSPKTYDFRGKRIAVVMAGNPYTETGEVFRIPDMLSNRADIYNLGDMLSGSEDAFLRSYIENCLTSHPVLAKLTNIDQTETQKLIELTEENHEDLGTLVKRSVSEGHQDLANMLVKCVFVRNIVQTVNQSYIASAAQDDSFRTEPGFLLQGSYRDMNKIMGGIQPAMNESELLDRVIDHYRFESQLLTSSAEFNFLRFLELIDRLDDREKVRIEEIRGEFRKTQRLSSAGKDGIGNIIGQLDQFNVKFDELVNVYRSRIKQHD